jgi:hypothetical protein
MHFVTLDRPATPSVTNRTAIRASLDAQFNAQQ